MLVLVAFRNLSMKNLALLARKRLVFFDSGMPAQSTGDWKFILLRTAPMTGLPTILLSLAIGRHSAQSDWGHLQCFFV